MKLYTIDAIIKLESEAFKKAVKDVRVAFSGYTHTEIKKIIRNFKADTLEDYVYNNVFPFDFE